MTVASDYADFATTLRFEDLPEAVVDHTKKLLLDIMANDIGGHDWMESGPKIVSGVRRLNAGRRGATVLATGEGMAPEWATLVNATMAHSLDYDNHHAKGVIHAGSSVVNAALAAGEETGASGTELIVAIVVGYEIASRLAMALGPHSSHEMGSHPTGTCATFAGSAVVGRLRGASAEVITNALGLNGSQCAGSMQYILNGAWNKRAHPGLATHNSFVAVTLAEAGFVGAAEPITGEQGFLQQYALRPQPQRALEGLGEEYETLNVAIKPYSLCRYTHQTLDLLLALTEEVDLPAASIESIIIEMPTYGVQLCGSPIAQKRNPQSPVDAQFSGPFAAALAITERKARMGDFHRVLAEGLSDDFRRILSVTDVKQADDLDAIHPEFWPGRITVKAGGETYERYSKHMKGERERPMSMRDVQGKFEELAPDRDPGLYRSVYDAVDDIENLTVNDLIEPLRRNAS